MVDWSGHSGQPTECRYRAMARRQLHGVSPIYERLCLGVADDPELLARLETLPPPKRQPNLLLGTVRFLSGPVDELLEPDSGEVPFVLARDGVPLATAGPHGDWLHWLG